MKKILLVFFSLLSFTLSGCLNTDTVPTSVPVQITASLTPTALATPTNLPLISSENRKDVLTRFVQENGGCKFPCVFGITPGASNNLAVKEFINYFDTNSHEADNNVDGISIDTFSNDDWVGIYLGLYESKVFVSIGLAIQIENDKVTRTDFFGQGMQIIDVGARKVYGDPYYDELLKTFSLSTILKTYGQPDQIIIRPFPDDLGHPSPPAQYTFGFVLFYPEQGFIVEYIAVRAENENNFIGCPARSYVTSFSSWNSNESLSINDAVEYFSNLDGISKVNISEYKQLQDVTSIDITDFYNTFKTPNSDECIQTLKELWLSTAE